MGDCTYASCYSLNFWPILRFEGFAWYLSIPHLFEQMLIFLVIGMFESCVAPILILIISSFYKKNEQASSVKTSPSCHIITFLPHTRPGESPGFMSWSVSAVFAFAS